MTDFEERLDRVESELAIRGDGDEARGECDVAVHVRLHSGRWVRTGGTYRDRYRRVGGEWLIAHRDASTRIDIDPVPDESEIRLRLEER